MNIETLIPDTIFWSRGVEAFTHATIDIVRELAGEKRRADIGRDMEWDSDTVVLKGDEQRIIRRIIPSLKSYVGPAHIHVPGHAVNANLDERLNALKQKDGADYAMSGILHSHASFGCSFSGTDYKDFETEGARLAKNNLVFRGLLPYQFFENPFQVVIEGTKRTSQSKSKFDPVVIDQLPNPDGTDPITLYHRLLDLVHREHFQVV